MAKQILVIEDDPGIADLVRLHLEEAGYEVDVAPDGQAGLKRSHDSRFALIILDLMFPSGPDGLEGCRQLRARPEYAPTLMLTARAEPDYRIKGLEIGVDDYLAKPFEPRELLLRLRNILSRRKRTLGAQDSIRMGEFTFHIGRGELKRLGESVRLTERERDRLRHFAERPGSPISRMDLAKEGADGSERAVDVQINRLRRKIEADPGNPVYLQTVRGKGYILHAE